ncbi:phosphatase [Lithospermum erythrorhizon]|uniref:Deoxyuridine 5'-triphosphate nucleotidohydrolase n=1 Tax=Lithospermum erythrorhizon TaxID=34254 RepID=A0AAV3QCE8_LITER
MANQDGDKQNMDIKRAELFNLVEAIKKCIPVLKVRRLSDKATLPKRVFPESAAYDLYRQECLIIVFLFSFIIFDLYINLFAMNNSAEDAIVPARGKAKISLDLSIDIPPGTYGRIAPRSSKAWNNCIDIGGGVVDADKNPVFVILFNHSDVDYEVKVGVAIAQLVLELNATPQVVEVHQ